MRLQKAKIVDFRSIKSVEINFTPSFRVLVGVNEAGKSNLLKALRLLDPSVGSSGADKRNPLEDEAFSIKPKVTFEFSLDASDHRELLRTVKAKVGVKSQKQALYVDGGEEKSLKHFVDRHKKGLIWEDVETNTKQYGGYVLPEVKLSHGWFKRVAGVPEVAIEIEGGTRVSINSIDFLFASDYPELDVKTGFMELTSKDLDKQVRACLVELVTRQRPECIFWTFSPEYLLPPSINIDAFIANPSSCLPLQHMFGIAGITDIPATLSSERAKGRNALRNLLERVAKQSTRHISGIWKEWKGLEIQLEPTETEIDASVRDSFNRYNFADRSDGFKRFVSFLLIISSRLRSDGLSNKLLLMDEPELGLHPSGVRYLRDELLKIAQENFVVVSTHSIFMVDRSAIGRHLIVSKAKEITSVTEVGESNVADEEVIFNALGYSIFENLQPKNFIFEGWRDKRLFDVAIGKPKSGYKNQFEGVGRCFLQGVKDVGRVVPLIELGGRDYLILTDSDEPARTAQSKFRGSGAWVRYDEMSSSCAAVNTAEDFLLAKAFTSGVKASMARHPSLSQSELADPPPLAGRIQELKNWLAAGSLSAEDIKVELNSLKSAAFEGLALTGISELYFEYLDALNKR